MEAELSGSQPPWEDTYDPSKPIYPYYVETEGLRTLAQSVKLELPTGKQVTKSKKLRLNVKGAGGEKGGSETEELVGGMPLIQLAAKVEEEAEFQPSGVVATGIADAAPVSDERILDAAITQIRGDLSSASQTAALPSRVKNAFGSERIEALAAKKRREFAGIAKGNQMLIFGGQFAFKEDRPEGCGPTLRLTNFNPTPGFLSATADEDGGSSPDLIPLPDGIGLNVTLPDEKALNFAGRERILRKEAFYARIIAHSPSFNETTGALTCSAWAVWGEKTPSWDWMASPYGRGGLPGVC